MARVTIPVWIEREFDPECYPTRKTVISWINNGYIVGKKTGKSYYVEMDAIVPANDLVNKVLRDS